jgi:hypothetical protein
MNKLTCMSYDAILGWCTQFTLYYSPNRATEIRLISPLSGFSIALRVDLIVVLVLLTSMTTPSLNT